MVDDLAARDGLADGRRVAEVALEELDPPEHAREVRLLARGQVVQDDDLVAVGEQAIDEIGADEPGSAGHAGLHVPPRGAGRAGP